MTLIVITGGIGAGKSTVLTIFKEMGFLTADADEIVHRLYIEDPIFSQKLVSRWGQEILTCENQIDRKKIASFVFAKKEELQWLNQLLHERVKNEIISFYQKNHGQPLFVAIPLYYEVGWSFASRVIAIWCSKEIQIERLKARGWNQQHIEERLANQLSADQKLEKADWGLINNGDLLFLRKQCQEIISKIKLN